MMDETTRIDRLEMRLTDQETTIDELNRTVTEQWRLIDRLVRQIEALGERMDEANASAASGAPEAPPPHY